MKLVKGFSLIEVILAMAISIGLMGILFQSLTQSNVVLQKVITFSALERKTTVLQQLWDREISGIIVPAMVWDENAQNQDAEGNQKESDSKDVAEKDQKESKDKTGSKDEKKEQKKLPQPFVYEMDEGGNLKMFTFITTNSVAIYGEPQVRLVRVMYRLQPDPENPGTFIVLHQQSENLDPKKFSTGSENGVRCYPVIDGVKKLTCEFLVKKKDEKEKKEKEAYKKDEKKETPAQESKDAKKDEKEAPKKVRQLQALKEWKEEVEEKDTKKDAVEPEKKDTKEKAEKKEKKDEDKRPELPLFIHIALTLQDDVKKIHAYDYWYAPLYDIEKALSSKSTGLENEKDRNSSDMAFNEHQGLLTDAGGMAK